jgi:hypothetical protein
VPEGLALYRRQGARRPSPERGDPGLEIERSADAAVLAALDDNRAKKQRSWSERVDFKGAQEDARLHSRQANLEEGKVVMKLALAILSSGLLLGIVSSGLAQASGSGQVVFTNSVSGQAGKGSGTFTYGGVTTLVALGFTIRCSLATDECVGSFYVAPISLTTTGQALTIHVSGTISGSSGIYTITLTSPEAVAGCTLTNAGTAPGATPTQTVNVECTGNGTTTLSGGSAPGTTAIVNVTGP